MQPTRPPSSGSRAARSMPPGRDAFLADFGTASQPLLIAGALNSLAQTLAKLVAPGVPDIYQGAETWELSLVDPDNRRPVDFDRLAGQLEEAEAAPPARLLAAWRSGLPKLHLVARGWSSGAHGRAYSRKAPMWRSRRVGRWRLTSWRSPGCTRTQPWSPSCRACHTHCSGRGLSHACAARAMAWDHGGAA